MAGTIGPWWIRRRNIGTFLESVGVVLDGGLEAYAQSMRLTQPLRCDPSALPVLSYDRTLRIYPTEPLDSQRARLAAWLPMHRQRGTHQGEMRHSQPYFLPSTPVLRIVHQAGDGSVATWHTLAADGTYSVHVASPSNWPYMPSPAGWSKFWVILYAPVGFLDLALYDDGTTWGGAPWGGALYDGVAVGVATDILDMIREWKRAGSQLHAYIVATDPASFDPSATAVTDGAGWTSLPVAGNWSRPVDVHGVYTRLPTALWLYDLGDA